MPWVVPYFVGALAATFLVSRLWLWLFKHWKARWPKIVTAHMCTILTAAILARFGDSEAPLEIYLVQLAAYTVATICWLVMDIFRK